MMATKKRQNRTEALFEAALHGDLSALTRFTAKDADVNIRNNQEETLLLVACRWKKAQFVESLIKLGADVDAQHSNGRTAMFYAKSVECVQKLIDHGASIDVKDNEGKTVLMLQCDMGEPESVNLLITKGVDVNVQDMHGNTAAMYAADHNQTECLQHLLNANADVDLVNKKGQTVVTFVISCCRGCLELLLKNEKVFSHGGFMPKHRNAILKHDDYLDLNFQDVLQMIECGMFEWKWLDNVCNLDSIIFPAVYSSIGPGLTKCKEFEEPVSALSVAFLVGDNSCIKFLLANRFFLPEDYVVLSTNKAFRDQLSFDKVSDLLERLTLQPLSLQTWSFLTVSKAISQAGPLTKWSDRVKYLRVPEGVKRVLRFQSSLSNLCFMLWEGIDIEEAFDSLNFRKEMSLEWSERSCDEDENAECEKCFPCDGTWKPIDGGMNYSY